MNSSGNPEGVNATKDTSTKPVMAADSLPAEDTVSSERVGELFNLALGGGADAPLKGDVKCKSSTDTTRDSYSKSTATGNGMLAVRGYVAKERVEEPMSWL